MAPQSFGTFRPFLPISLSIFYFPAWERVLPFPLEETGPVCSLLWIVEATTHTFPADNVIRTPYRPSSATVHRTSPYPKKISFPVLLNSFALFPRNSFSGSWSFLLDIRFGPPPQPDSHPPPKRSPSLFSHRSAFGNLEFDRFSLLSFAPHENEG